MKKSAVLMTFTLIVLIALSLFANKAFGQKSTYNPIDLNATDDSSRTTNSDILKYRFYHSAKADLELTFVMISTGISFVYNSHMINIDKAFEEPLIPFPEGTPQSVIDEFTILPGLKKYRENHDDGNFTSITELFIIYQEKQI